MDGARLAARGQAPHGHWKATTFLVTLRHHRIDASWLFDGPIDGEGFRTYVEKVVVPTLRPGDIVIMDLRQAQALVARGRRTLCRKLSAQQLPECSPRLPTTNAQIIRKLFRHA
jgi:hypothetical protein